ncbi:MAG TPA: hypothetical protein VFN10_23050 [Thermoanaerobaculia bacterium]|nr:hypothetical protein [Thermoanaerobaculia bacterium]
MKKLIIAAMLVENGGASPAAPTLARAVILAMLVGAAGLALPAFGDDLVAAAKANKAKRKASTTKVITNADVKKSKGTVIELKGDKPAAAPLGPSSIEKQEAERRAREANAIRLDAATKKVAELEKQLAQLEQKYFEENDPDVRDRVIRKQFDDVKAQLDAVRQERDALTPPAPPAAD